MGIWKEILDTLQAEVDRNGGPSNAAKKLGISRATLWTWLNETRGKQYVSLFTVLDNLGIHLIGPEEAKSKQLSISSNQDYELVLKTSQKTELELREKCARLEGQNELLREMLNGLMDKK